MRLVVTVPSRVQYDLEVDQVVAESTEGHFGLLPRHVDTVALLVPGILTYVTEGTEHFLAVNGGMLAKIGDEVTVATSSVAGGVGLDALRRVVEESYLRVEESEQEARAALGRLESDMVRRLVELEELSHG